MNTQIAADGRRSIALRTRMLDVSKASNDQHSRPELVVEHLIVPTLPGDEVGE
jgi:hypothetical protein